MPDIEFITLSRNPDRVAALQRSIALSLGTAGHRLTVMDGNRYDLFTGYNAAVGQTSGEMLVFVHDDVQLLGNALVFGRPLNLLEDPTTGFIGAAGSRILESHGAWWGGKLTRQQSFGNCRGMVMHGAKNEFGLHALAWPGGSAEFGQVIVVDGVLLMCHRRTLDRIGGFDAATYKGFHFYDVDITFRAHLEGLKNYAAPLPLLHGSRGNMARRGTSTGKSSPKNSDRHCQRPCSFTISALLVFNRRQSRNES